MQARRRKWQPTPVFLPGESHGQRSLVGYSPWGRKESDPTERLHFHFTYASYSFLLICINNTLIMCNVNNKELGRQCEMTCNSLDSRVSILHSTLIEHWGSYFSVAVNWGQLSVRGHSQDAKLLAKLLILLESFKKRWDHEFIRVR